MTNDLVRRLREPDEAVSYEDLCEAAERIEQLEAALTHIWGYYPISVSNPRETIDAIRDFAFGALAGEKKDE